MTASLLTASRLKTYRRCPRLHQIRYELGYRPVVESEALRFGTLIHAGLESWWRAESTDRLSAAISAVQHCADPYERARAEVLLVGYHHRWQDEPLTALAVEVEFTAPLVNPATGAPSKTYALGGKLDVIAQHADGRVFIVDHKTSSEDVSVGSTYWTRLRMDGQVSTYFDGAAALGLPADGCIYDVIAKPSTKPRKATPVEARKYTKGGTLYANQRDTDETVPEYRERLATVIGEAPDDYYRREEVVRLESELIEHRRDMWALAEQLRDRRTKHQPRNPDGCSAYGRSCEYLAVCAGMASLDDTTQFVRMDDIHPELSLTAKES